MFDSKFDCMFILSLKEEDDSKVVEISLEALAASASQTDDSRVTKATTLSAKDRATANAPTSSTQGPMEAPLKLKRLVF